MIRWELVGSAAAPGGGELRLYRRGAELSLRIDGRELMNSRVHASEVALGEACCAALAGRRAPRVLVGGLGMGFTLGAILRGLGPDARLVVAELVGAVVAWNRGELADLAGRPLEDPRVEVLEEDVFAVLTAGPTAGPGAFSAVVLDVDNGPAGLTWAANDRLYGDAGLQAVAAALQPRGVLIVWSAAPNARFVERLGRAGFAVREQRVRAGGARHVIWIASRGS